jgi:hypothetical protein
MAVKPILFNTEMVRAILAGRKNVTRRVIKPQPMYEDAFWKLGCAEWSDNINSFHPVPCHSLYNRMPYKPEDILYVRETWGYIDFAGENNGYVYKASENGELWESETQDWKWRPSIHMSKEAARIWLRVTDVRVERLQYITEEQARMEGVLSPYHYADNDEYWEETKRNELPCDIAAFSALWDSTIKKTGIDIYGWNANPWVWVIEFERCDKPKEGE